MNPLRTSFVVRGELAASVVILILASTACSGHVAVHPVPLPPPPPPPPVWWEGEPNDTAWLAPWFGSLFPGESIQIVGHATDDGSDPQDGLAFTGFGPCRIDFTLYVDDPWSDLDVWVYDPAIDEFLYAFDVPYGNESGTFWLDATQEFHLVIVPSFGSSNWTMVVSAAGQGIASAAAPGLPAPTPSLSEYRSSFPDPFSPARGVLEPDVLEPGVLEPGEIDQRGERIGREGRAPRGT